MGLESNNFFRRLFRLSQSQDLGRALPQEDADAELTKLALQEEESIKLVVHFQPGTPFFKNLELALQDSVKPEIRAILVMPQGWNTNPNIKNKLTELEELKEARGNASFYIIGEEQYDEISRNYDFRFRKQALQLFEKIWEMTTPPQDNNPNPL